MEPFFTDDNLVELEREAVEWVAEVAEREEAEDEFADLAKAFPSPVEHIAAAPPPTSAPIEQQ